jgi:hypothetical protein
MKTLLAAFFLTLLASASVAHSSATIDSDAQQQQQLKKNTDEPSCPPRTLELREITVISRLVSLRGARVLIQCATKDTAFGARQLPLQSVDVDTLFYNMARVPDISLPVAQITCGESVSCVVDVQARSSQLFGGYYGMPDRIFGINSDGDCWFDYESFNSPASKEGTNSTTSNTGNQAKEKENTNSTNALDSTSKRAPVWYCELRNRGSYALGCAECEGRPAPSDPVLAGTPWSLQNSSSSTTQDTLSPTLIIIAGVVCCLAVVLVSTALFMKWRRYRQGDRRAVELIDRATANGGGGGGGGGGRPTRPTFKPAEWYEIDLMEEGGGGGGGGGGEVKMTDVITTATTSGEEGSVHITTNNKNSDEADTSGVDSPGTSTSSSTNGSAIIVPRTTSSNTSTLPSPYHKGPILVLSPGNEDSGGAVLAMGKREAVVIVNRLGEEEEGGSSGRRRKRQQGSGSSRIKEPGNNENGDRVTVTPVNDNGGD